MRQSKGYDIADRLPSINMILLGTARLDSHSARLSIWQSCFRDRVGLILFPKREGVLIHLAFAHMKARLSIILMDAFISLFPLQCCGAFPPIEV